DVAVAECRRKRSGGPGGFVNWISSPRNTATNRAEQRPPVRRGLFLNYKTKGRTVSTVSESPSPEPPGATAKDSFDGESSSKDSSVYATIVDTAAPAVNSLRSSFHKFIRSSRKNRAISETVECFRGDSTDADADNIASLASEEVFEDDSSLCTEVSLPVHRSIDEHSKTKTRNHLVADSANVQSAPATARLFTNLLYGF
ncbi:hypothetical protein AAVH_42011, partial [Aphelenchoides avenae]